MRNPNYTYADTMKATLDDEGHRKNEQSAVALIKGAAEAANAGGAADDMNGMLEDSNKENMNTGTSTGATSTMRLADRRVEGVCGEEMQRIRGGRLGRLKRGGGSRGPRPCGAV